MNSIDFKGVRGYFISTLRSRAVGMGVWVYMVDGAVIDSGYSRACHKVFQCVETMNGSVKVVFLTHAHEDHVGCAGALARQHHIQVVVPGPLKKDIMALQQARLPFYRDLIWGEPTNVAPDAFVETETWAGSDNEFEYVATPGHCPNHYAIHDKKRNFVFLGDLYLGPRMTMSHPWEAPETIADSLRKVRAMDPEVAFCAHRGLIQHPRIALTRKIEYIEWLVDRSRELAARGMTLDEITFQLLGREKAISKLTRGLYSRRNVIRAILNARDSGTKG